jgi:hypothetical protein
MGCFLHREVLVAIAVLVLALIPTGRVAEAQTGYRTATWGMNVSDAMEAIPGEERFTLVGDWPYQPQPGDIGVLTLDDEVAGLPVTVDLVFTEAGLSRALVRFKTPGTGAFERALEALTTTYGQPSEVRHPPPDLGLLRLDLSGAKWHRFGASLDLIRQEEFDDILTLSLEPPPEGRPTSSAPTTASDGAGKVPLYRDIEFGDLPEQIESKVGEPTLRNTDSMVYPMEVQGRDCGRVFLFAQGRFGRMGIACEFDILSFPDTEDGLATARFLLEALTAKYGEPAESVERSLTSYDTSAARALQVGKYRFSHRWTLPGVTVHLRILPADTTATVSVIYDNPERPWQDIVREQLQDEL